MKKQFRIASKYLIERSHFFSKSQLVLSLQENYLQMQPLSSDREEKDGGVTRIDWELIIQVQASERNPKEFTISAVPENKKKQQTINKANAQQQVFSCKDRNRLLTEIIHKLHIYNQEKPYLVDKAYHQNDIYKEGKLQMVQLKIHPSVIQVIIKQSENRKRLGGKLAASSTFRGNIVKKDTSKNTNEETKRNQSEQEESELEFEDNGSGAEMFQNQDYEEDEELSGYESESNQGIMLTPYKGSMIGGTILGEESAVPVNEQIQGQAVRSHFIYLCEIDRIIINQQQLIIVKKNQEIDKFIFRSDEKALEFLIQIKKNYKDTYKTQLTTINKTSQDQNKIFNDLEFLVRESKPCYSQNVKVFTWDGIVSGVQIDLDEKNIYEVDQKRNEVRKKCQLKDLEMIRVIDKNDIYNLVLMFKKEIEMVLLVPSIQEREKLISCIMTLRNFVIPQYGYIDQLKILVNSQLDFTQKILGLDSLDNQQFIQDYEGLLFRKITENISYKDNMKINNLIEEALLNASFCNVTKIEQKNIKIVFKEIVHHLEQYLQFEANEQEIVENYLKKNADDHVIDYATFKKSNLFQKSQTIRTQQNPLILSAMISDQNEKQQNNIYNEDGIERIKQYEILQERTSKYLNILNLILKSKAVFCEISDNDEIIPQLIKLLVSKNPFVTLQSSQVLRSLIEYFSGTETKFEIINKKLLIRGRQANPQQTQGQVSVNQDLNLGTQANDSSDSMFFLQAFKEFMQYFDYLNDSAKQVKTIHLFGLQNIMRSILIQRRSSTSKEEIKVFADLLFEDDIIYTKLQEEIIKNQGNQPQQVVTRDPKSIFNNDPLKNKPFFHLFDRLSLLGDKHFDVLYFCTLIFDQSLNYYKRCEPERLLENQQYILTYSVQFVWHLYLQSEAILSEQRRASIHNLSKILYQNKDSIQLLLRCIPKTLVDKVETHLDLTISLSWGDTEWEDFFIKITTKNYDSATELWNDETRQELKVRLLKELKDFEEAHVLHKQVINDDSGKILVLPNHEFNKLKKVISRSTNLKWNYMEFGVKYDCLTTKYLVWKYYLTKLLKDKDLLETQRPDFTETIDKPIHFWQELKIKFMSSFDQQEQIIILKTMCVLYNKHFEQLKDLKSLPYFLKLFDQQQYEHCHFILVQLIHVSLSVNRDYSIINMRKFIKSGGLHTLMRQMKLVFKELLRPDRIKPAESNPQLLVLSTFSRDQYERILHGEGLLLEKTNYTNSKTNSRYFKRNSEFVCTGILCLKILDLIFREMYAIDYVPLPANREFLLRPQSLAILSQSLMVENIDLSREVTIFIETHMNNHFSYFKLKNSGMIEYLILALATKNGDRSLEILQKFQEVSFDYNSHLKIGLFNSNDLQMLQDDREKIFKNQQSEIEKSNGDQNPDIVIGEAKKVTILAESIFLRFLPIPFIKFLYEEGQEKFLQIYKMNNYESPILIWNSKLRSILEQSIIDHSSDFIQQLKEFSDQPAQDLKKSEYMPTYNKKFKNIVKYPDIENEVRCGRYYLRVWVNQKKKDLNFFDIPQNEEEEFHKNLQIELRHCIYEENFGDQQKIIILFKACLQTLHRFKNKRTFSLDEIKRILIDTCKNQPVYNDTVKQMIYIGIKIIYQVVRRESQQFIQNSVKSNADSLKEALTKIGVEIIGEIFTLILKNSFNTQFQSIGSSKYIEDTEQLALINTVSSSSDDKTNIKLDRIEAKTLSLCIQSFNIILNTDILAFVDFPLVSRINLFRQVSRLLDASFTLLPLFKDKLLSNQVHIHDSRTFSSFTGIQQQSPKGKNNRNSKSKRSRSKKSKKQKRAQQNQPQSNPHQSWQMVNITNNNQSQYNPHLGQMLAKPTQNQLIMELDKYNFKKERELKDRKKIHKKDPNMNYNQQSLLQIIHNYMDKHSIELIFDMTRSIFELTREITKNPVLHPELIASGMAWKALKYIYLQLKEQTNEFSDLRASLREATATLKNLISFAHQLANLGAESFVFKNLTKETEKEIMKNFLKCIKSIFGSKIQETLISSFIITNNELHFEKYDSRKFLQQFSVREENSPELVWNDETRKELLDALDKQISNLNTSFYSELIDFEYSVNKRELRVEDIFVRHYNNQSSYRLQDIDNFASKLIEKLREITEFKYVADFENEQYQNCIELLKAIKIIIINENLIITELEKFEDYLQTFCNLIQIKPDADNNYNPSQEEIDMIKGVSVLILEIILHISKTGGQHFDYLKNNNDFIRLLIRALYQKENDIIDSQTIISILQNMILSRQSDIHQFLIATGLIMFILNQIFEKKTQNTNKKDRVELIKLILQSYNHTSGVYERYIPAYFFVEIQQKQQHNDIDTEKIIEFIKELDAPEFENVFIIWNSNLKQESHQRIKRNCEKIVRSYEDSNYQFLLETETLVNPKLQNEIIVKDVILRIYNKNPAVFINTKLNTFILHLSQDIWVVSQELFKISQGQLSKDEPDDLFGREPQININNSQKLKALCNKSLILLTSLLLSLEQLLLNDYNSNRLMANKREDKNAETKFYKQIIEKTTDQTQLDDKVYKIISYWLQTQVFLSRHIPVEIRITFFQIIFLIIDVSDAVKVFKDNQTLMQFITDSISSISTDKFSKTIEEALILLITQKMLRKDSEPTPVLLTNSMPKLFKIYDRKKKLKKLVEFILALMASDQQYKQSVVEYIKKNQAIAKIDTKLIFEGRHENTEHTEAIMRIWRGKPASSNDSKRYYDITECFHIEDKVDETNIPKMKLPMISKKSVKQFQKEELFFEEEKKAPEPLSARNARGNSIDLPFSSVKESKLGYQPFLDDIQIGGNDLEAIEKQDEYSSDEDDANQHLQ